MRHVDINNFLGVSIFRYVRENIKFVKNAIVLIDTFFQLSLGFREKFTRLYLIHDFAGKKHDA